jgi:hypothetical protein
MLIVMPISQRCAEDVTALHSELSLAFTRVGSLVDLICPVQDPGPETNRVLVMAPAYTDSPVSSQHSTVRPGQDSPGVALTSPGRNLDCVDPFDISTPRSSQPASASAERGLTSRSQSHSESDETVMLVPSQPSLVGKDNPWVLLSSPVPSSNSPVWA